LRISTVGGRQRPGDASQPGLIKHCQTEVSGPNIPPLPPTPMLLLLLLLLPLPLPLPPLLLLLLTGPC
jgi:hypothetical protein